MPLALDEIFSVWIDIHNLVKKAGAHQQYAHECGNLLSFLQVEISSHIGRCVSVKKIMYPFFIRSLRQKFLIQSLERLIHILCPVKSGSLVLTGYPALFGCLLVWGLALLGLISRHLYVEQIASVSRDLMY